jgi:C4-dicarboxylate-specific signal transduction histidine kinase
MVNEAARLVLQDPEKGGIPIEFHFDEHLPKVYVDPLAIQEVFINLTSNAMEVMEHTNAPLVEVCAAVTDQNEMLVQVIDNGPGIGDTEEIFDAFVTTKKNGLGSVWLCPDRSPKRTAGAFGLRITRAAVRHFVWPYP